MAVKLTDSQMTTLKSMVDISGKLADQLLHIMQNSGLDKIPGCSLRIEIEPELKFVTKEIKFGKIDNKDSGYVALAKGVYDAEFKPTGDLNSAEYELLFADEATREILEKQLHKENPIPPDGMWIGNNYNDPPLDIDGHEITGFEVFRDLYEKEDAV